MRITQWGEYGVHFSVMLARAEREGHRTVGAAEVAKVQGVDVQYAQQIFQRLRKGNIVESVRGPQGGYRLARPAVEITLKDILLASEGDTFEVICDTKPLDGPRCAPSGLCGLRPIWHGLKAHVDSFLNQYNLEALSLEPDSTCVAADKPIQIGSHNHSGHSECSEKSSEECC